MRMVIGLTVLLASWVSLANQQPEILNEATRAQLTAAINTSRGFEDRFDAEVWLVDMSGRLEPFIKDTKARFTLLQLVYSTASDFELDPTLVLAVMQIESTFNQYAISSAGAQGIMQVMPFWKQELGTNDDDLLNLKTNIRYGCAILKHYIDREKGDLVDALARYNGSYGSNHYSAKVMTAWYERWQ